MVSNRSFTLTTGNGQRSRLRRLKNGVPQGSVLAPLLFNIYTSDLPIGVARVGPKGPCPPKCLEKTVILCLETHFFEQNNVIRRKSNILSPQNFSAPQIFELEPPLDLPAIISRKYAYANDLAIMHADGDWLAVEGTLSKDMATLGEYLQTWKLKLSTTKTGSAVFHLNNKEAKRELKLNFNNENLPFCSEP